MFSKFRKKSKREGGEGRKQKTRSHAMEGELQFFLWSRGKNLEVEAKMAQATDGEDRAEGEEEIVLPLFS